jgi:single-strand DNA-binding protein
MAQSCNKTILLGYVGSEPEASANGPARVSLATTRNFKDAAGEWKEETEWHRLTMFGRMKETALERVHKGSRLFVEARLHYSSWTDAHDQTRYATELIVEQLIVLDPQERGAGQPANNREPGRKPRVDTSGSRPAAAARSSIPAKSPFQDDDDLPF